MGRRGKFITETGSARDALGRASDIAELQEELDEWRGNMESNNMDQLPKYAEVEEAYNMLESAELESRVAELEAAIGALPVAHQLRKRLDEPVEWREWRNYGKRALCLSRSDRCSNACSAIRTALEALSQSAGTLPPDDAIHEAMDEVSSGLDEAEATDFPGMY